MKAVRLLQKELLEGLPQEWCTVQLDIAGRPISGRLRSGSNLFLQTPTRLRHRESVRVTVSTRWGRLTFKTAVRANLGVAMYALAWPRDGILLPGLRDDLRPQECSVPTSGTSENEAA